MPSAMACRAASLISAGAGKSGSPCERLTALCFTARRVISRMTDSVNCSALAESMRRAISSARVGAVLDSEGVIAPLHSFGRLRRRLRSRRSAAVNHPVGFGVSQDDLHVLAGFGEGDGLDELSDFFVLALGRPGCDAVLAGVIRGERLLGPAKVLDESAEIGGADSEVVLRIDQFVARIANAKLLGHLACGYRQNLHQADGAGVGKSVGLKSRFLADQAGDKHRIEAILGRLAAQRGFVG